MFSVIASVGQVSAQAPQATQVESRKPASRPAVIFASNPRPVAVSAKAPWTSSQARTQRPHEMHSSCWKARYGWRSSWSRACTAPRPPAPGGAPTVGRDGGQLGVGGRRDGELGQDELDDRPHDPLHILAGRGDLHPLAARGRARRQRPGRALGRDQADPAGAERGLAIVEAQGRHVAAGGVDRLQHGRARRHLDFAPVDRSAASAQPQLVCEVLEQAADRRRHAAAVGAQAADCSSAVNSSSRSARGTGSARLNIS